MVDIFIPSSETLIILEIYKKIKNKTLISFLEIWKKTSETLIILEISKKKTELTQ